MSTWERLLDSDVPLSLRLRRLWITVRCYFGHDAHWVPSYHFDRVYSPWDEYSNPKEWGGVVEGKVVGWRFRCQRCNRDLYWGTPPDDGIR